MINFYNRRYIGTDNPYKKNSVICIENEILRYRSCVHIKGINNHSQYIDGMIDLAARLSLITNNEAIMFRNKNFETKKKFLLQHKEV